MYRTSVLTHATQSRQNMKRGSDPRNGGTNGSNTGLGGRRNSTHSGAGGGGSSGGGGGGGPAGSIVRSLGARRGLSFLLYFAA
jgi:hypothetical protein